MKRKRVVQFLMLMLVLATVTPLAQAVDLPTEAFGLLAQAMVEPCAICAEKERTQAVKIMQRAFVPGQKLTTDATCRLVKTGSDNEQALGLSCYPTAALMETLPGGGRPPHLVFTFHSLQTHLIGIAPNDYTDPALAAIYHSAPPGTCFEGQIRFIAYKYGDGPAFNYFPKTDTVQVHCALVQLNAVKR